jgi:HPt (histidine-containing phosphotransfer) domain-containing protein
MSSPKVLIEKDMEQLVTRFLARKRGEVEHLRAALEATDYEAVRRLGHDLKGAGAGFGFPELTLIGGQLEGAAKRADAASIRSQVDAMERYLTQLQVSFS